MQEEKILKLLQGQMDNYQESPRLGNQFLEDVALQEYIGLYFSLMELESKMKTEIRLSLADLGKNVIEYQKFADDAERNPPTLQIFDAYGKRINQIHTSEGWKKIRIAGIKEGIIADVYSKKYGVASRFVEMVRLYLFQSSSGMWGGPMAVTDGAAYLLKQQIGHNHPYESELVNCFERLTSRNPDTSWSSGQWTIEKEGDIDPIKRIQTVANETKDPFIFKLYGVKWYTAAPEGDVSIVAARILDPESGSSDSRLSAFLVKLRDEKGNLKKGIDIIRMKNKLGMKTVPAVELVLKGVEGILLSQKREGLKTLSPMFGITRMYNSSAAVSLARRVHVLCKDYSLR